MRGVWRLQQSERSVRRSRQKRPLRRRLKKQLKTLRKLSHLPKRVSVRPHLPTCQNLSNTSVLVVLQHLLKLNLLFQPTSAAAAARSSSWADTHKVISTSCLQYLIYQSTKKSRNNSYCCCCYSLMFVVVIISMGRSSRVPVGTCANTVANDRHISPSC
jgi:hypothetical protein